MKDLIVAMQEDLEKALPKPGVRNWGMLIDLRKCVGCHGCTVACISENKLPPGVVYRPVYEYEQGKFPRVQQVFLPRPCMQCDDPPCVKPCPKAGVATWKETKGVGAGLVHINYDECIGCGQCVEPCPYGARSLDGGEYRTPDSHAKYELAPAYEYRQRRQRKDNESPMYKARKCHFCFHRIAEGYLPQCVTTCIGRATYFGDMDDPDSQIAQAIKARKVQVLKAKRGTKPRVYYIADQNLEVIYG